MFQEDRQSDESLVADKTNLNTGPTLHYRKTRDQPSVQKIAIRNFTVCRVEHLIQSKGYKLKLWQKSFVLLLGQGLQDVIFFCAHEDHLPFGPFER